MGMAFLQNNNLDESKTALQKAVEVNPKIANAHLSLGAIFNAEKNYPEAEKSLTQGLELLPESAEGQYELAKTYWAMGRLPESEAHASKAVAVKPDMPPVHVLLGNICLRKHDTQGAIKEYKQYLLLDPSGPFATSTQSALEKLSKSPNPSP